MPTRWYNANYVITNTYPQFPFAWRANPISDEYLKSRGAIWGRVEASGSWIYKIIADDATLTQVEASSDVSRFPDNAGAIDTPLIGLVGAVNQILALLTSALGLSQALVLIQYPNLGAMTTREVITTMTMARSICQFNTLSRRTEPSGQSKSCDSPETITQMDQRTEQENTARASSQVKAA